jgi:hypothetical protein
MSVLLAAAFFVCHAEPLLALSALGYSPVRQAEMNIIVGESQPLILLIICWCRGLQLNKIFAVIGTPAPEDLEEVRSVLARVRSPCLRRGVNGAVHRWILSS